MIGTRAWEHLELVRPGNGRFLDALVEAELTKYTESVGDPKGEQGVGEGCRARGVGRGDSLALSRYTVGMS